MRSEYDWCVYYKRVSNNVMIYLLLYVDDMLLVCPDKSEICRLKSQLKERFKMKDLGLATRILGMEIKRDRKAQKLWLYQKNYLSKVLNRFEAGSSKPVTTPMANHYKLTADQSPVTDEDKRFMAKIPYASAVGSLMFSMICSRPDLAYAISLWRSCELEVYTSICGCLIHHGS